MPTTPGPGDPETWGLPTGHPNDPRTEEQEQAAGCLYCSRTILLERGVKDTWVDLTGGDVCMNEYGEQTPHQPDDNYEPDDYEPPEPDWEDIAESIAYERHEAVMYRMDREYG